MRYTHRNAVAAFEALAETVGAPLASDYPDIHDARRNGAWLLDRNHTYGGYVIAAHVPDSPPRPGDDRPQAYTAETHPLGSERRSTRDFVTGCWLAVRAIGAYKQNHT